MELLEERELLIKNRDYSTKNIIGNRTIMNFTVEFVRGKLNKVRIQALRNINCVRKYKGIVLSFELVRIDEKQSTNAYHNNYETLQIE